MALQVGGWFSIGLATYTGRPEQASPALGLILAGAATVLLVPAVTALLTKVLAALVMLLTSLRFYLTAAYELSSAAGWKDPAGIAGLVLTAAALYARARVRAGGQPRSDAAADAAHGDRPQRAGGEPGR
jgi:succinate-acetate transporter protein